MWAGARGAGKYLAALATGDVAGSIVSEKRLATACAGCPATVRVRLPLADLVLWYCGPVVDPQADYNGGPTCGCLIACETKSARARRRSGRLKNPPGPSIASHAVPAGKTLVASEACPRGRYVSVTARGRTLPPPPNTPAPRPLSTRE